MPVPTMSMEEFVWKEWGVYVCGLRVASRPASTDVHALGAGGRRVG